MLEKKTLLKLYWRGNKINNYFLLVVFVLFVMFFLKMQFQIIMIK